MAKKRRMLFAGCKEIYPGLAKTGRPATSVVVVAVTVVAVLVVWLVILCGSSTGGVYKWSHPNGWFIVENHGINR